MRRLKGYGKREIARGAARRIGVPGLGLAPVEGLRAARMEAAARRRVEHARHLAAHDAARPRASTSGSATDRGEQRLGIGMQRTPVELVALRVSTMRPRYITAMQSEM
jgi:hypothetical protein